MDRIRLRNRRGSESFDFEMNGVQYTATVSRLPSGDLAEIFLNGGKMGSEADHTARDSAVVTSIALQYGVPAEVIRHSLGRDPAGNPVGPLAKALDIEARQRRDEDGQAGSPPEFPAHPASGGETVLAQV